jgi:hypothetical protein
MGASLHFQPLTSPPAIAPLIPLSSSLSERRSCIEGVKGSESPSSPMPKSLRRFTYWDHGAVYTNSGPTANSLKPAEWLESVKSKTSQVGRTKEGSSSAPAIEGSKGSNNWWIRFTTQRAHGTSCRPAYCSCKREGPRSVWFWCRIRFQGRTCMLLVFHRWQSSVH